MRLLNYITEERSTEISDELWAIRQIKSHCGNALKALKNNKFVWRGASGSGYFRFVQPKNFNRISANTTNLYTLIMDNTQKWSSYPKRSKSIVCATSRSNSSGYGDHVYIVLPKDGYKFGVCPDSDMWGSFDNTINANMDYFNTLFDRYIDEMDISDKFDDTKIESLKLICHKLDMILNNEQKHNTSTFHWVSEYKGDFFKLLQDLIDPNKNGFKIIHDIMNIPNGDHEIWTDSDCYFMSPDWYYDYGNQEKLIG